MAHKLLEESVLPPKAPGKPFHLDGKIGLSLFLFGKEVFVGLVVSQVVIEQIYKRKYTDLSPVKVYPLE